MSVRKGASWGARGPLPEGAVFARSDGEARALVEAARRTGEEPPPIVLLGGDLCRTLGGRGDEAQLRSDGGAVATVDVGAALIDGRMHRFVAHLVARRPGPLGWWRGRIFAAMNAQFLGRWDVAPRSHPGDGLLDALDVRMSVGQRFHARRRLRSGGHVPHPAIAERRTTAIQVDLDRGMHVWLDGDALGAARTLSLRIEPDALTVIV